MNLTEFRAFTRRADGETAIQLKVGDKVYEVGKALRYCDTESDNDTVQLVAEEPEDGRQ